MALVRIETFFKIENLFSEREKNMEKKGWQSVAIDADSMEQILICNDCSRKCETRIEYGGENPPCPKEVENSERLIIAA